MTPTLSRLRPGMRCFLRVQVTGVTTDLDGQVVAIVETLDRIGLPFSSDGHRPAYYVPEQELVSMAEAVAEVRAAK